MQHTSTIARNIPWFKSWFDSAYYHKLYAHRSEKEAADFIDELISELQPVQNAVMLDVGCGNGRHCRQLAAKGFNVTGIDLALSSIRHAKKYETPLLHFFQHDMRRPFGNNHFDYIFSFFTSFGYFKNETENQKVIHNMSYALKPGGTLAFDYINAQYATTCLVPSEKKEIDGIIYSITRWTDEKNIYKRIVIDDEQVGENVEYTEQVAKLNLYDFKSMLEMDNLEIEAVFGDYKLGEYDSEKSPRLIIVARKNVN